MTYIFEDWEDDILSLFFQQAYPREVVEKQFIYANGTGNIKNKIVEALNNGETEIYVFMDLVPDNLNTVIEYQNLLRIYGDNTSILIFPIPCSEYYVIRSMHKKSVIMVGDKFDEAGDIVRNRRYFLDADIIDSDTDRKFCKNFEKFCKLFLKKAVLNCAKTSECLMDGSTENTMYNTFYKLDCVCSKSDDSCTEDTDTSSKNVLLATEYPCIPSGSLLPFLRRLTKEEVCNIHIMLVDQYNEAVNEYRKKDIRRNVKYKNIQYMRWVHELYTVK